MPSVLQVRVFVKLESSTDLVNDVLENLNVGFALLIEKCTINVPLYFPFPVIIILAHPALVLSLYEASKSTPLLSLSVPILACDHEVPSSSVPFSSEYIVRSITGSGFFSVPS